MRTDANVLFDQLHILTLIQYYLTKTRTFLSSLMKADCCALKSRSREARARSITFSRGRENTDTGLKPTEDGSAIIASRVHYARSAECGKNVMLPPTDRSVRKKEGERKRKGSVRSGDAAFFH